MTGTTDSHSTFSSTIRGHIARAARVGRTTVAACVAIGLGALTAVTALNAPAAVPSAQAVERNFPDRMYFGVTVSNGNLDSTDAQAFRGGFGGFDTANPTIPTFSNAQLNQANEYFRDTAAYCMDVDKDAPGEWSESTNIQVVHDGTGAHPFKYATNPNTVEYRKSDVAQKGAVAWIAANGYPQSQRAGSQQPYAKSLDDPDARAVTQLAIWIAAGQVRVQGGNGTTSATSAVSVSDGHKVAGGVYSSGGQTNFAPYTMIGLAWDLANKAQRASDRDEYEAVFYTQAGGGGLQRMLFARSVPKATRGGVQVVKTDRETTLGTPLGAASLNGTGFEIVNRSTGAVVVNDASYEPGQVVKTLSAHYGNVVDAQGNPNGSKAIVARTGISELPPGSYEVRETVAPDGYLRDTESRHWSQTITIGSAEDDQFMTIAGDDAAMNQVQRSDLHFTKKDANTMQRMGVIAWQLTSKTTGETHVIVSDTNGSLHTKSCETPFNGNSDTTGCRPHTHNTNANDPDSPNTNGAVVKNADGSYTVRDASKLDPQAGIWFTGIGPNSASQSVEWTGANTYRVTRDGQARNASVNDALRALPYDDYQLTELPTPGANDDHRMISVTVSAKEYSKNADGSINHDGTGIDLDYGTLDNETIGITTRLAYHGAGADAFDGDGNSGGKTAPATGTVELTDTADYWGLTPGDYSDMGALYVVNNGETVGAPLVTVSKPLTVKNPNGGTAKLTFTIANAEALAGKTVVAFRTITDENGNVMVVHNDASDGAQQVSFPQIHTQASSSVSDEAEAAKGVVSVSDEVAYENLQPGKEYTMNGELHHRTTAESGESEDGGIIHDVNGDEVRASLTFTPTQPNGTVTMTFLFEPSESLAGATVVAFEELHKNSAVFAAHADIDDDGQSVRIVGIATQASDASTHTHTGAHSIALKQTDVVAYTGVQPGTNYEVRGELHIRNADGSDGGALTDKRGNAVTTTAQFVAEEESGQIKLEFSAELSRELENVQTVAFERLYAESQLVAVHADIHDDGQTVSYPAIGTTLAGEQGEKTIKRGEQTTLIDAVAYSGLTVGEHYSLTGKLVDGDGNPVNSSGGSTEFVAEQSEGSVTVEFTVNAAELDGKSTIVAFEYLSSEDGTLVAQHEDLNSESQTVRIDEPAATDPHETAATGSQIGVAALLAAVCIGVGLVIVLVASRRSRCKR